MFSLVYISCVTLGLLQISQPTNFVNLDAKRCINIQIYYIYAPEYIYKYLESLG